MDSARIDPGPRWSQADSALFDLCVKSRCDAGFPRRVLNGLDGNRIRIVCEDVGIHADSFARPAGTYPSREPFGPPSVTRSVFPPLTKAEEPSSAIRTEFPPPRFIVHTLDGKHVRLRHRRGLASIW